MKDPYSSKGCTQFFRIFHGKLEESKRIWKVALDFETIWVNGPGSWAIRKQRIESRRKRLVSRGKYRKRVKIEINELAWGGKGKELKQERELGGMKRSRIELWYGAPGKGGLGIHYAHGINQIIFNLLGFRCSTTAEARKERGLSTTPFCNGLLAFQPWIMFFFMKTPWLVSLIERLFIAQFRRRFNTLCSL